MKRLRTHAAQRKRYPRSLPSKESWDNMFVQHKQRQLANRLQRYEIIVQRRSIQADLRLKQDLYETLGLTMNALSFVGICILFTPGYSVWLNLGAVAVMIGTVLLYLQNKRLRRKFCAVFTKK